MNANVELVEGQALFRVAKDHARPFVVQTAGIRVRAVGTQFDVYRKASGTQVTVVEGRVAVFAPGPPVSSIEAMSPDQKGLTARLATGILGMKRRPYWSPSASRSSWLISTSRSCVARV